MITNLFSKFQQNRSSIIQTIPNTIKGTTDETYLKFISEGLAGYFFNNALHIYGSSEKFEFHDKEFIQTELVNNYNNLIGDFDVFAEDIFGNQFGFTTEGKVDFFNIESAEKENISDDFEGWLKLILEDTDYLTGISCTNRLQEHEVDELTKGFRLSPKMPFIIGGAYENENLYLKYFSENIKFNASLAYQIVNLEDGQQIKLNIT